MLRETDGVLCIHSGHNAPELPFMKGGRTIEELYCACFESASFVSVSTGHFALSE